MEGIENIKPSIKKIEFKQRGKISFLLQDGRIVIVPIGYFPSIKRLTETQRKHWYVTDGEMFSFDACNEVFHLEQVLGKEVIYKYSFIEKK
ncbi:MAG: DUF2442 domain-containing protein [Bacteroidota bacterium]